MTGTDDKKAKDPGWGFWFTLCAATIVGMCVNQLEGPYARSIVVCDTPVNTTEGAPKALSKYCGDRLYVIGEGARLSAKGQGLENFCKIFMAILLGNLLNIFGRKPMMILAIGSMWFSVLLFLFGTFYPSLSHLCFVFAQGIQGMATGDMLTNIVFADLAASYGGADVMVKKEQILGGTMFVSFWLAQLIASLEMTDYKYMWAIMTCIISVSLYACVTKFPETMPVKKSDDEEKLSFGQRLLGELGLYKQMFKEKPIVCWSMLTAFLSGLGQDSRAGLWAPFMMSCYGYTQQQIVLRLLPFTVLAGWTGPWVNEYCKKAGFTKGFHKAMIILKIFGITLMPLCATCWWMPWLAKAAYMPLGGYGAVFGYVRNRLVGEQMVPKLESMQFLNYFVAQSIGNNIHWMLFNERAATAWQRFVANQAFTTFTNLCDLGIALFIMYPCIKPVLQQMDSDIAAYNAQQAAAAAAAASAATAEVKEEPEKNDGEKKTD